MGVEELVLPRCKLDEKDSISSLPSCMCCH